VTLVDPEGKMGEVEGRGVLCLAVHYGVEVATCHGDMRDLSRFADGAFDLVWHAHSLNFVPDAPRVCGEVARVLRPGGPYRMTCTNPFIHGVWERWTGEGYAQREPYVDGAEVVCDAPCWDFEAVAPPWLILWARRRA